MGIHTGVVLEGAYIHRAVKIGEELLQAHRPALVVPLVRRRAWHARTSPRLRRARSGSGWASSVARVWHRARRGPPRMPKGTTLCSAQGKSKPACVSVRRNVITTWSAVR
jgi:hypothetical protein